MSSFNASGSGPACVNFAPVRMWVMPSCVSTNWSGVTLTGIGYLDLTAYRPCHVATLALIKSAYVRQFRRFLAAHGTNVFSPGWITNKHGGWLCQPRQEKPAT